MNQIIVDDTQSPVLVEVVTEGPQGGIIQANYGSFYDTTVQTLPNLTQGYAINLNSTSLSNNVSVEDSNKIVLEKSGVYSLTYSVQLLNYENNVVNSARVWVKYNGENYPYSASYIEVPAYKNQAPGEAVLTVNFIGEAAADGDYVQLFWTASSTNVSIATVPNGGFVPAAPGAIVTVSQVG